MAFDPMDPRSWNTPFEGPDDEQNPTVPLWTVDEWQAQKARSDRYMAINRELDGMRLSRKVDALISEIEHIWLTSESAAEDRVLRMIGQVTVQIGHPELFRLIYDLVVQGTPACGDVMDWLELSTKSGPHRFPPTP